MAPPVELTHPLGVSAATYWVRARPRTVRPLEGQHRPTTPGCMQHATGYVHGFGSAPQCGPPTHTEPLIVMRLSTHSQELSQTDAFRHYQAGLDGNVITTKALWS